MKRRKRDTWEQRFAELRGFRRRFGHCRVPVDWYENRALAKWMVLQRHQWGHLPVERLRRLHDLGFNFGRHDRTWLAHLFELVAFRSQHGHCRVPQKWSKNRSLGSWVTLQRTFRERLTDWRRQQLERLDFDWDPYATLWEARLAELQDFQRRFGHCCVPDKWVENPILANWVQMQRRLRVPISPDRRRRLDALGFAWSVSGSHVSWLARFRQLKAFRRRHGHCNVPRGWSENRTLADWVHAQRGRQNRLTGPQRRLLNRLGFDWKPKETRWEQRFSELERFRARHGHCRVPQQWAENPVLAHWVESTRVSRRHNELSPEHRRRLDAMGFDWQPKSNQWEKHFAELKKFKTRFGHCRVPNGWPENPSLASWVARLRLRPRLAAIEGRRQRLNALGFVWRINPRTPRKDWQTRFQELQAFRRRFGHCRVPQQWTENRPLSRWVCAQRRQRDSLPDNHRRRLEAIGFDWTPLHDYWERRFAELEQFHARHGHCRVPESPPENPSLRSWIKGQRAQLRKGTLMKERRTRLDSLDFEWNPDETLWERRYSGLRQFHLRHGHCLVPEIWPQNPSLGRWVAFQRQRWRHQQLSLDQKAKLDALGFAWKVIPKRSGTAPA